MHSKEIEKGSLETEAALERYINTWNEIKEKNDSKLKSEILEKLIKILIAKNDGKAIIPFLKEKLLLIDKRTDETDYIKTIILLITYLLQSNEWAEVFKNLKAIENFTYGPILHLKQEITKKVEIYVNKLIKAGRFDGALDFLSSNTIQLDSFLNHFLVLHDKVIENPSKKTTLSLIKLFNTNFVQDDAKTLIEAWKDGVYQKLIGILSNSPIELLKDKNYKLLLEYLLQDDLFYDQFLRDCSQITEQLVEDPHDHDLLKFLNGLNDAINRLEKSNGSQTINSWIEATDELKENQFTPDLVYHLIDKTNASFAAAKLIQKLFDNQIKEKHFKADVNLCNNLSEFLHNISEIIYQLPDSDLKTDLIQAINHHTNTVASGYAHIIFSRMKKQQLFRIMALKHEGIPTLLDELSSDFSETNPAPYTRSLQQLIELWRYFPKLQHLKRFRYGRLLSVAGPSFWFFLIQLMYAKLFRTNYEKLPKSEDLHHKNLIELVAANVDFFYRLRLCLRNHFLPIWTDLRVHVIQFLKYMDEKIQLTDFEIRTIVNNSHWKVESEEILSKVIEFKNYCIYCSFNMPADVKECPNCGRDQTNISSILPEVDSELMESFFSSDRSSSSKKTEKEYEKEQLENDNG